MSIRTAVERGVAAIEIARPEKKNALNVAMYAAMAAALRESSARSDVRAVLICGQPGTFTAGNDLEDFVRQPPGADSPILSFMHALLECDKPVVAAVTGLAIGIGVTMLLHCDLVYVAEDARLALPFTRLGLTAEFGSSLLLPRLMGHVRAAEKLLLGEPFTGAEAVACGIANAALPAAEVLPHARRMAERFNDLPPGSVRDTRNLMRGTQHQAVLDAIAAENALFTARLRSPEAREALEAFLQKRAADFSRFS